MKGKNRKHNKRVKKLVFICTIFAIVIMASTYAWFIGMKTVNVNSFEINVATTEGLFLSMDGKTWSYNLDVTKAPQYEGNTNVIKNVALIPMSSVGDMDSTSSTMMLYEKGSLTAIHNGGGYRLLASRVANNVAAAADTKNENDEDVAGKYVEGKGYVAFDLFVKNLSGVAYYDGLDTKNEEAIYLTRNSKVVVSENGGEKNTGIENSVRVAFTQIGRVTAENKIKNDDAANIITGITCTTTADATKKDTAEYVTGICRDAQIWEPNDTKHVQNAFNWYNKSCLIRTGADVNDNSNPSTGTDSYGEACEELKTAQLTKAFPTYAISRAIDVDDKVNIYDGLKFNTYTANTTDYATYHADDQRNGANASNYKLVEFPYFTDTMKDYHGVQRPPFMTLAPNSVTKVRVYIYLEGQDIDNYDFASLGKKITVNFGFTKERYDATLEGNEDIDYTGPGTDITKDSDIINPNTNMGE